MKPALQPVEPVFVKELATLTGLSEDTILRRMHKWEENPKHPTAIPYLVRLGKPFRTTRQIAERLIGAEVTA